MKFVLDNEDMVIVKIRKRTPSEIVKLGLPHDEFGNICGTHGYRFDVILRSQVTGEPTSIINPALEYLNFKTLEDLGLIVGGFGLDNPDILEELCNFNRMQLIAKDNGKRTEMNLFSPHQSEEMHFESPKELIQFMMYRLGSQDMV